MNSDRCIPPTDPDRLAVHWEYAGCCLMGWTNRRRTLRPLPRGVAADRRRNENTYTVSTAPHPDSVDPMADSRRS